MVSFLPHIYLHYIIFTYLFVLASAAAASSEEANGNEENIECMDDIDKEAEDLTKEEEE